MKSLSLILQFDMLSLLLDNTKQSVHVIYVFVLSLPCNWASSGRVVSFLRTLLCRPSPLPSLHSALPLVGTQQIFAKLNYQNDLLDFQR